jgi:uncharacterized protein YecT (DUF1311 family)
VTKCLKIVFLVTLSSLPCVADMSDQYRLCSEDAKTQARMNACANEEAARSDAEANGIYLALLARTSRQPEALAKVKAAERAWTVYRNAYIDAMYPAEHKQVEQGSVYPMEIDLLRANLTREHVMALRQLLQRYSN